MSTPSPTPVQSDPPDRGEEPCALFQFLFPYQPWKYSKPRYVLHAPDLCSLLWSVWDSQEKKTIARSNTPQEAVRTAISLTRPFQP